MSIFDMTDAQSDGVGLTRQAGADQCRQPS